MKETFSECQDLFIDDAPSFFQLLDQHFDLESFIPDSFFNAFYRSLGRKRLYPLSGFLAALILQKIFSIPTDSLLILFLNLCKELRDFCGFQKVPDASLFTRFKQAHPEMPVEKKSDSPDEDKSIGDSSSLKPVLSDFFALHPYFQPDTFLGDSAFDTIDTYENMDFRMFPGIQRDANEWISLYKIRTIVERAINHFKINMCVAGRRTRNHTTTKADVFLAGIASQLTVIVAYRMNCPQYIRSLKPLVA